MSFLKQNKNHSLEIFHFDEMKYNLGEFSVRYNSTEVKVSVKESSLQKRIIDNLNNREEIIDYALSFTKSYPQIYGLGNIKSLSKIHIEELESIHNKILNIEILPGLLRIGTGKGLNEFIENNKLSSKQVGYLSSLAERVGESALVDKKILDGKVSQENFLNVVVEYGYDPEKKSLDLLSEQLAELKEFQEEHFEALENAEINIINEIELGFINRDNYDEVIAEYLSKININNLGYQR